MTVIRWHRPGFVNDGEFEPGETKEVEADVGVLRKMIAAKVHIPEAEVNLSVSRSQPDKPVMLTYPDGQYFVLGFLDGGDLPELPEWRKASA